MIVVFLGFQHIVFFAFWGGFNYSKMANSVPRTYCNICWNIFGTSKNVTKDRPSGPLFITKVFQKIYENVESFNKNIAFVNLGIHIFEVV